MTLRYLAIFLCILTGVFCVGLAQAAAIHHFFG